jgi:4-hydroxy-2-oxoheptanedioate aldolase
VLEGDSLSLGLWNVFSDSQAIRAASPYIDFVIVDLEHGFRDWKEVTTCVLEARSRGLSVWVRLRSYEDPALQTLLDFGIVQFIVPQIRNIGQIDDLRSRLDYPPKGVRGQHPKSTHGLDSAIKIEQAASVKLCVIFETQSILTIADEVLDHSGVDCIYLGTYDLSAEMQLPQGPNSPVLEELLAPVVLKANSVGKVVIAMNGTKNLVSAWRRLGVRTFVVGIDSEILRIGIEKTVNEFENSD